MPTSPWAPAVSYTPPPPERHVSGVTYPAAATFPAKEMKISKSWGLQPAECEVSYVGGAPISVGGVIKCVIGGHYFWGFCTNDLPTVSTSEGVISKMRFVDMRELFDWDIVVGQFNKLQIIQEGTARLKRYAHIYPDDARSNVKTYTNAPLTAAQIIAAMLGAPTVESPWIVYYCHPSTGVKTIGYHPALAQPAYGIHLMGGSKLGAAIQQVLDQVGLVCTIISDNTPASAYHLVFARKGEGPIPLFPAESNNRRDGTILSKVPTRVRVIGERNRYQLHDISTASGKLVPDWAEGWEQFFGDPILMRDWIFKNLRVPAAVGGIAAGTPYNNIPADVDFIIGKQLAMARAYEITVAEFATARDTTNSDGADFRDYRKYQGKTRMLMPAWLYVSGLVYRAFRLADDFTFVNGYGQVVDVSGIELVPELMAEVTHNHTTGQLFWDVAKAADGAGYAVVQGFRAGSDAFKAIRPDRFDIDKFTNQQDIWTHVPFQIDDSGSFDGQYIVFDEPIIRTTDLFTKGLNGGDITELNGYAALNANATFTFPPVNLALCMRAENFIQDVGIGTRDDVINVPNLQEDFIGNTAGNVVVPYTDGDSASDKAIDLGNTYLARQWYYRNGGFDRPLLLIGGVFIPTALNGSVDRITVELDTAGGLKETVDFTGERSFTGFTPERNYDRGERDKGLYPGQKQLQQEANDLKNLSVALKKDPNTLKAIAELFAGYKLKEVTPDRSTTAKTPAQVKAYTPLKKKPNVLSGTNNTNTAPVVFGDSTYTVFAGVNVGHNDTGKTLRVVDHGEFPVRVKGPVNPNDSLGLSSDTSSDYLVKGGIGTAGVVLQAITDTSVKVVMVRLSGGGGGSQAPTWV